jgi:hypothetical protein
MANHADTKSDWAQARRQVRKSKDIKPHGLRWQKRNEGRKGKQEAYAANLLLAATDADEQSAQAEMAADDAAEAGEEARAGR